MRWACPDHAEAKFHPIDRKDLAGYLANFQKSLLLNRMLYSPVAFLCDRCNREATHVKATR